MESYTFVFFGIVGSGKGTQVKLLQAFLKARDGKECVYAYPGNEYRRLSESETQTASLVKDALHRGDLQPDFLTNSLFMNILIDDISLEKHMIADGYPRTLVQSEFFEKVINFYKRGKVKIINLEVGKEEAIKRMKLRGRSDDTEEGINRRFDEYERNVLPAINYFQGKDGYEIYNINGEQTVEEVAEDIRKALGF